MENSNGLKGLRGIIIRGPAHEVIKLSFMLTQLRTKVQLHIKTKILSKKEVSCFKLIYRQIEKLLA